MNNTYPIDVYIDLINNILDTLYQSESILFEKDLCERSLVFRFSYHLQKYFEPFWYYVDCDYNSSYFFDEATWKRKGQKGKPIQDLDTGEITGRFVDIIVHKRLLPWEWQDSRISDLICFECKKWNNKTRTWMNKDINNLRVLSHNYWYDYWFHLIFWKQRDQCKIYIYRDWNYYNDSTPTHPTT